MSDRLEAFGEALGSNLRFYRGDLCEESFTRGVLRSFRPDAIVHLAEMPSAPYSMIDCGHAVWTQRNNTEGTLVLLHAMRDHCPDAHLLKLGSMGEYGTPPCSIPEGFFTVEWRGDVVTLPFPRNAGSWYHQSKVHDSENIRMACRLWGLRSTDVMQGVVYGTRIDGMEIDPRLATRFDADQAFGTAINRFVAQAVVGEPITPFGKGLQTRGFLPLRDSMQCFALALENPPEASEYRVFNQFEDIYSIRELAQTVKSVAGEFGLIPAPKIVHVENNRLEAEEHIYKPDSEHLPALGYRTTASMRATLLEMFHDVFNCRGRLQARKEALRPDIHWSGERRPVEDMEGEGCRSST